MTDRAALRYLALIFAGLFLFFTRVHGPRLFFIGQGDDESYFSYARTLLFDRDLNFANEPLATFQGTSRANLSAARYALGPGLLWSPFLAAAHLLSVFDSASPEEKKQGITTLHWLIVCGGSILYGFAGYLLIFLFLRRFFDVSPAFWSTVFVGFSSPLLYYLFNRPLMSHSTEVFVLALSAYLISGLHPDARYSRVAATALATGFIFLCRWMDAPYVVAMGCWALWNLRDVHRPIYALHTRQVVFIVILGVTGSLQLFMWKHLTGMFYPGIAMFDLGIMKSSVLFSLYPWTGRHFVDLWGGRDWGLAALSPITLLSLPALALWREKQAAAKLALLGPTLMTFLVASNWPSHGGDYANRYLIPAWLFLSFLYAEAWAWIATHHPKRISYFVGASSIGLLLAFMMLTLFKSNTDSLTLQIGPTLYQLPSDWVNHRYALEAYDTLLKSPFFAISTFGASLIGYMGYELLSSVSIRLGPLATYFEKHPAPAALPLSLLILLVLAGILAITRVFQHRRT